MPATFQRDRLTWLAYLLLAFYGYYINVLGPITPFLKNELGLTYTVSSLHYTAFALGILLVGLGGNLVTAQLGRWRSLWAAAFGLSLGTLLLLLGKTPVVTIGASLLMGLVGSLTLIIVASALSDQHGELRAVALSEANVIASLVASAAPLMVGGFAGLPGGWRLAIGLVALTPLALYPLFRHARPAELPPAPETVSQPARGLPPLYWAYWLGIVLAVAAEFCMISWSADYFETVLGLSKPQAPDGQPVLRGHDSRTAGREPPRPTSYASPPGTRRDAGRAGRVPALLARRERRPVHVEIVRHRAGNRQYLPADSLAGAGRSREATRAGQHPHHPGIRHCDFDPAAPAGTPGRRCRYPRGL